MFNFGLNEDQVMLRTTANKFMTERFPVKFVRQLMEDPKGYPPDLWKAMAELGWMGVSIPEAYGGMGMGLPFLMVLLEQMGRVLAPVPYLETVVAAEAIVQAGSEAQKQQYLPKIASGDLIATLAVDEPDGFWEADAVVARAVRKGDGYRVSGVKLFVPYAHVAGLVVCAVRTGSGAAPEEGITLLLLDPHAGGVTAKPIPAMDETYRLCELTLDGVAVPATQVLGKEGEGWAILDQVRQKAAVLAAAEMVGGAERAMEMVVEYSKMRQQFGQLIGVFQAIKHRCVDMLVDVQGSRGTVYYAAWALENQAKDAALAVSSAKAYASDTYVNATKKGLQSFGGIGFTWEHDIHLFLKRARRLEMAFGDATYHREKIASLWL
jgi:alkylation response protein AidB-like acyl-CoA dehydrogenase